MSRGPKNRGPKNRSGGSRPKAPKRPAVNGTGSGCALDFIVTVSLLLIAVGLAAATR